MFKRNIDDDMIDSSSKKLCIDSLENELDIVFKFPELCTYSNIKDTDIKTIAEIFYYCLSSEEQKKEYARTIETATREYIDYLTKDKREEVYKIFNDIISSKILEVNKSTEYLTYSFKYFSKLIDYHLDNKLIKSSNIYGRYDYISQLKDQLYHGKGKLEYYINNILIHTYEGIFKDDNFNGLGILTFSTGNVYTGEFINDKFHGNGKMIFKNGNIYEGTWKENKFSIGTFITKDKIYSGNWIYCLNTTIEYNNVHISIDLILNGDDNNYKINNLFTGKKTIHIDNYNDIDGNFTFKPCM